MLCPQCEQEKDISAKVCSTCDGTQHQAEQQTAAPHTESNDPDKLEEFYKAMVGNNSQRYYLRHFFRFDSDGKAGASWNWSAFFATFFWLLYRKMWLSALVYFVLAIAIPLVIATGVANMSVDTVIGKSYSLCLAGILILPPIYANAIYYRHCKKKISGIRSSSHDLQRQLGELSGKGGISNLAVIVVLATALGIFLATGIQAYKNTKTLAKRCADLDDAVTIGTNAAESAANYYYRYQLFPNDLAHAGFAPHVPSSVKKMSINSLNGVVTITLAKSPFEGKTLLWVPSLDANSQIIWKCINQDIQDMCLPYKCQRQTN